MNSKEVMYQALDALDSHYPGGWANDALKCHWDGIRKEAITSLRQAIIEQDRAQRQAEQEHDWSDAHQPPFLQRTTVKQRQATQEQQPDLLKVAQYALAYIDAIPADVVLPAMPGFDRDWADNVIEQAHGITTKGATYD